MQLRSSAPAPDSPIIRTGSDGRLRYSPEQRQTLLDAFDRDNARMPVPLRKDLASLRLSVILFPFDGPV